MNGWTGHDGEPTLASVQSEFPLWSCWRGTSGLYYGRRPSEPPANNYYVRGEDPMDLRDEIIRAEALAELWTSPATGRVQVADLPGPIAAPGAFPVLRDPMG